ncbi:divergent polysaccharide deacetylase family protein [Motiliproteus coralliicola]|uniref:Divergent polysaccharide deacetylase family protein n=2 Tax=Motiliproteus coralliicola TaxID=2283196 RepID=A0A369W970_9GAMM|nr:divergent polysaccharide deacetylase family protein [Motiliproteus coralliicola]
MVATASAAVPAPAATAEVQPSDVSDSVSQPALVIIIDDVGDNYARGLAAVELPGPVTYAVLPHSPFGPKLARKAYADGKDVILHAPMQNTRDRPLGPGALTADLGRQQFRQVLEGDLDVIPHVQGLNNHMGSLLTTLQPQMNWVMELARERGLFFIDSRTTASSVAWETARRFGVPNLKRDVFLDHERTTEFVHRQFIKALAIARRHGSAVVIGHPYPVTVDYLKLALPLLDEQGIRLLTASALIMEKQERLRLASRNQSP